MKTLSVKESGNGFNVEMRVKSFIDKDDIRFLKLLIEPLSYDDLCKKFRKEFDELNEDNFHQTFIELMIHLGNNYLIKESYGKDDKCRLTDTGKNILRITKNYE